MDHWILDNLEKLVPIVIALLYFLGSSKAKKAEQQRKEASPEADARARRIQEEIRRKILERQQHGKPVARREPPPNVSEPVFEMPLHPVEPKSAREVADSERYPSSETIAPEPIFIEEKDPYEEQRTQIEEQLQKARELREQVDSGVEKRKTVSAGGRGGMEIGTLSFDLRSDLKSVGSIRRAIVLKEVLGKPIALR